MTCSCDFDFPEPDGAESWHFTPPVPGLRADVGRAPLPARRRAESVPGCGAPLRLGAKTVLLPPRLPTSALTACTACHQPR
jgi:hypothetical protein